MGAKTFWRSIRWWEAGPAVVISGDGAAQAGGGGKRPAKAACDVLGNEDQLKLQWWGMFLAAADRGGDQDCIARDLNSSCEDCFLLAFDLKSSSAHLIISLLTLASPSTSF